MADKKQIFISSTLGLSKIILAALFVGAVVVAPGGVAGTLEVINKFIDEEEDEYSVEQLRRSLQYLKSKKLIDIQRKYSQDVYGLTKVGRWKASRLAKSFVIEKPKRWDGKWRIIVFDIPIKDDKKAHRFRRALKHLGFAHVQKSIWAHPYECRDQVFYLAEKLKIKPCVRYIVAESVTGEEDLMRRFGLGV